MEAFDNLPQKSYRFQNGVRIVSGYGASIRVDRGPLVISDRGIAGTGESRLERIGHGLSRLVVISRWRARTPDRQLRRLPLHPTELWGCC